MAINIRNAILVMLLMAGLLLSPGDLSSCGPFLPDTEFAFPHDPEDQAAFARGQLGILNPRYDRIWLFIAYRWLKGTGLNSQEQEALLAPPTQQAWQYTVPPAVTSWIEARSRVPGARLVQIFVYRNLGPPTHSSYLNCPEDAFRNAQQTLQERIARLGANHEAVRAWLAAQDQVFAN